MKRIGKKFGILVILIGYLSLSGSHYLGLRKDAFVSWRTPVTDKRILSIIKQAEETVKPGVEIHYYSLATFSEFSLSWQNSINAQYIVTGIWPLDNFDKVLINDVALERLNDRSLLFIIGHELGHARADSQWRGKGFLLANRNLYYALRSFFSPRIMREYLMYKQIEIEAVADEAGIECVGPEEALKSLEFLQMVAILGGFPTDMIDGRIEIIKDKYNLN